MGPPQGRLGGCPGGKADPGALPAPGTPHLVLLEGPQDLGADPRGPWALALQGCQQGECCAQQAQRPHPRHSAQC